MNMHHLNQQIYASRREAWASPDIQIYGRIREFFDGQPVISAIKPLILERFTSDEFSKVMPPFLTLTMEESQVLMDSLWECGLRPTAGHGSAGQLAATQAHLDDMRKLVSKSTGAEL